MLWCLVSLFMICVLVVMRCLCYGVVVVVVCYVLFTFERGDEDLTAITYRGL